MLPPCTPTPGMSSGAAGAFFLIDRSSVRLCRSGNEANVLFCVPLQSRLDNFFVKKFFADFKVLKISCSGIRCYSKNERTLSARLNERCNRIPPHVCINSNSVEFQFIQKNARIPFGGVSDISAFCVCDGNNKRGNAAPCFAQRRQPRSASAS